MKNKTRPKMSNYLRVGQHWQEVDNRFKRIVQVLAIRGDRVRIKTVLRDLNTDKEHAPRVVGRVTWASINRFSGKSHGYILLDQGVEQ